MNQNKHVVFTISISALPPTPHPAPAFTLNLSLADLSLVTHLVLLPLPSHQLALPFRFFIIFSQCPAWPRAPPAGARPGWEGLSRERCLGIRHRWRGQVHGNMSAAAPSFHPWDASLWAPGFSFQRAGYPLRAAQSSTAACQAADVFLHFGKYSRIP